MIIFTSILLNLMFLAIGYLIGSANTSIIISKILKNDVRNHHSNNAGATNSVRVLGKKMGAIILFIDILKTIASVSLAFGILSWVNIHNDTSEYLYGVPMFAGIGTVLGHSFPIFFGFKGGKGVACSIGLIISYNIVLLPIAAVFFFGVLFWKKYVSLASMLAAILLTPFLFISWMSESSIAFATNMQNLLPYSPLQGLIYLGALGLILWTHRGNILRLKRHEERKISFSKSK
ncbi:glycerol-3-phosphate 1-O-acyltransferase PlsY [Mycoplasma sp. Pen4]|uniref:glycerol-3-phosphate 1-O-acyltransferase PlsY n=1 Tax=Mycoplasma sp. Pen4 TaxID=640330 RepID=UPI00165476F8|nr:glycerol-3-phosphate 1-O-acyltransferase PlsY [Mycoplasma sp. Pen4]QNM93667.1 glycerol-3-phosphate 1-O-acyltransferase PlsY [Mycoplasma sp. Pen4]